MGLGYLAAAARARRIVCIPGLRLAWQPSRALIAALKALQPDLVGFTGYAHEASPVVRLARWVRAQRPIPNAAQ